MNNDNPKTAIDTILTSSENQIGKLTAYPLTVGRYALLELVESPFVKTDVKFTVANLIPTFYIMTSAKDQLKGYTSKNVDRLVAVAMDWANDLDPESTKDLIDDIAGKFGLVKKISPNVADEDASKKEQAQ